MHYSFFTFLDAFTNFDRKIDDNWLWKNYNNAKVEPTKTMGWKDCYMN